MIRRAVPLLTAALLAGCAHWGTVRSAWAPAPEADPRLREYLVAGHADSAAGLLERLAKRAPGDSLLRDLQRAVVLHQAGRFAESNAALERAEAEIDQRYTRSLSRAAGSLVLNDAVLAYLPPAPERAMIPYYRMLNHWALGDTDGATVEARKAAALLADKDAPCASAGLLAYLAGLVFAAGGERNDALVSLRQAERAYSDCEGAGQVEFPPRLGMDLFRAARELGLRDVADAAATRYDLRDVPDPAGAGELIVLVEHGFVAHRVHRNIHVPILPDELRALSTEDADQVAAAVGQVGARLASNLIEQAEWGSAWDELPANQWADALDGAHIFKLAWPAFRLEARRAAAVQVLVDDTVVAAPPAYDVSAGVVRAWEEQRPAVLARAVARGLVRFKLAREAESKAEKQAGDEMGWMVGRLVNAAGNAVERADTRAWTLLPDQISVARVSLPAGDHRVRLRSLGPAGEVIGETDLGTTNVRPGRRTFLSRRVWGPEPGDHGRFRRRTRMAKSRCTASGTPPSGSGPAGSSECR